MISVHGLSFGYDKSRVLFTNLSFDVAAGETLILLGQNGTGKSTLLNIISGIQKDYTGHIEINNKALENYSIKEIANLMAVVSTNGVYYQDLTVLDYLLTGFASTIGTFRIPSRTEEKEAADMLRKFGKESLVNSSINTVSSGEMQLIRIARALLQKPQIIVLDEPTANLDVKNQLMIVGLLNELKKEGYTIVIASHNPGQAVEIADKVLMLSESGSFFGSTEDMINEDRLSSVFHSGTGVKQNEPRKIVYFFDDDKNHVLYF